LAFAAFVVLGACNDGTGNCPGTGTIVPGAACDDDTLQCPFVLATPSPACDGTSAIIPSSCTCTSGTWSCPSPVQCSSDAGADSSADAASGDVAADAPPDVGPDTQPAADSGKDAGKDSAAADARRDG
jgi:hypothetical protein